MQIKRLDIGFWRNKRKKIVWGAWFEVTQIGRKNRNCGCHILTVGPLAITWMGDECLLASGPKPRSSPRSLR